GHRAQLDPLDEPALREGDLQSLRRDRLSLFVGKIKQQFVRKPRFARLSVDPENRIVMHCHPANLLAMTYVHPLDERAFTRTLWQMCTECIVVFPDGVNVLPWMLCGTNEIGIATAEKMRTARLVVWAQHGIYGAGKDLDETFGRIETAEKAAEIYMKIAHLPILQTITDEQMHLLEGRFGVKAREGYLD
ncbi:MAG: rhamnulose-1-phosphate aldolase, partial [Oscillospiraceae bacterium]|nr:rhamnulose-1-phosphate aldolase [Oscillospiraceae bacterium]